MKMNENKKTVIRPLESTDEQPATPGFRWHKFLVNFALYAAAVWNVISGVLHLTGLWYSINSLTGNTIMIQSEMYFYYPPVRIADIMFYVTMFATAAYQIVIRFMLVRGRKHAPLHLNIMIGIMCFISAIYDFLFEAFVRNPAFVRASINYSSSSTTLLTAFCIGTVLCVANWYYYKKRRGIIPVK